MDSFLIITWAAVASWLQRARSWLGRQGGVRVVQAWGAEVGIRPIAGRSQSQSWDEFCRESRWLEPIQELNMERRRAGGYEGGFRVELSQCEVYLTELGWRRSRERMSSSRGCPYLLHSWLPWWLSSKDSAYHAGDAGSIPGWGRSPGGENGNSLQYSCLGNFMDKGTWGATVRGVTKSQTWLSMHTFCRQGSTGNSTATVILCYKHLSKTLRTGKWKASILDWTNTSKEQYWCDSFMYAKSLQSRLTLQRYGQ